MNRHIISSAIIASLFSTMLLLAGTNVESIDSGRISDLQDTTKKSHQAGTIIVGVPKGNPITSDEKARQDSILAIPDKVFTNKEVNLGADPRQGTQAFRKWLQDNVHYSKEAYENKVQGIVKLSFIVGVDGVLSDFEVLEDVGFGTGLAIISAIQKSGKWAPAVAYGRPVKYLCIYGYKVDLSKR